MASPRIFIYNKVFPIQLSIASYIVAKDDGAKVDGTKDDGSELELDSFLTVRV